MKHHTVSRSILQKLRAGIATNAAMITKWLESPLELLQIVSGISGISIKIFINGRLT